MRISRLILPLSGYAVLLYLLLLLPFHLYTPTRQFDLPNILWLTHLILLYIHEAGHLFFSVFGRTLNILGGSLNQVLAPAVWYVVAKREGSALANVAMFFTGVSIVDVSLYMKDAALLQLPLIGGLSKSHHDWMNLFHQWDLVNESYMIGEIFFWIGMLLAGTGLVRGIMAAFRDAQEPATTQRFSR
ncbi:MAG: hypothetical protein KBF97_03320 [Bacteroidetes bacterium]|nr:hypothetical protein [Bacteroidota bacterium]